MEEDLQKLGLSQPEAKIYLAALALGPSGAAQLADNTGVKRPTVYLALQSLIKQGIISEIFTNKKRLFQAEKPEKLAKLTKRMRRQAIDAELLLETILPNLISLPKEHSEEPKVIFHFGTEGIKNVALEVAVSTQPWYFFGSSTKVLEKLIKLRRMDILYEATDLRESPDRPKIYLITDAGILSLGGLWAETKTQWREMKILPTVINASSGFIIYEDKLVIVSFESKPFAAVIKSKEVVEVVKVMYQLIWKSLS